MSTPLVEMRAISKRFGGVHALEQVDLTLYSGEVLGLVGHNGAGKSTLIKILSGAMTADEGEIFIDGHPVRFHSPRDARGYGIETIYQTLALADNLSAAANIFLGREITGPLGTLDDDVMESEARKVLQHLDLRLPNLRKTVRFLSGGQRQAVAIARAIYFNARVLIMDEPTAALGPAESAKVGELIRSLKRQGIGIILISHDIHDVFDLADRISVLHNGRLVGTVTTAHTTKDAVLSMIILGQPNTPATTAASEV